MRIEFHLHAVDEGARLALVGVDAQINRAGMVLGQERPLQSGGEAGPAAAAQPAGLHQFDDLLRAHSRSTLRQRVVSAARLVDGQRVAVRLVDVRQQDGFVGASVESGLSG